MSAQCKRQTDLDDTCERLYHSTTVNLRYLKLNQNLNHYDQSRDKKIIQIQMKITLLTMKQKLLDAA